jgi:hypothetical protein
LIHPVYSDSKGRALYQWGAGSLDPKIVRR